MFPVANIHFLMTYSHERSDRNKQPVLAKDIRVLCMLRMAFRSMLRDAARSRNLPADAHVKRRGGIVLRVPANMVPADDHFLANGQTEQLALRCRQQQARHNCMPQICCKRQVLLTRLVHHQRLHHCEWCIVNVRPPAGLRNATGERPKSRARVSLRTPRRRVPPCTTAAHGCAEHFVSATASMGHKLCPEHNSAGSSHGKPVGKPVANSASSRTA